MTDLELIIAGAIFSAVTALIFFIGRWQLGLDRRVDDRLDQLQNQLSILPTGKHATQSWWQRLATTRRSGIYFLPNQLEARGKLQARLLHAGIYAPWALNAFLTVRMVMMVSPVLVGLLCDVLDWTQQGRGLLIGACCSGLGMLLPEFLLSWLKRRRHVVLAWSLPDFLDLLVACLEAGMSVESALQRVSEELQRVHPVLGGEMRAVQTQIELGASPETALRSLADRSDFDPLRALSTVVQQARRFGTGVAEALRQHANSLRVHREQVAEERAQKASVQILVPTMLLIFPSIFVVLAGPAAIKLSESFSHRDDNAAQVSQSTSGSWR